MLATRFADLNLSAAMVANLDSLGYVTPTSVQAHSLPAALAGRDLIVRARTGSGKTAAFGIGLIEQLNIRHFGVQALVLCPTRELADQVAKELRRLARARDNVKVLILCGGVAMGPQLASLEHGAHIVVGTPGRIQDHLRKGSLDLGGLRTLVLDEADRMLDMGFAESIEDILAHTPEQRQTLLFSATWPDDIRRLSGRFQRDPLDVRVEEQHAEGVIEQQFFEIAPEQREAALVAILSQYQPPACVAFCTTKQQCDEVSMALRRYGFRALPLHGDMEQRDRDLVLTQFANGSCSVLVATDVAARGLDIQGLPLVINVEPTRDPDVHTHRIGRTGRAGLQGRAITLATPAEAHRVLAIEARTGLQARWGNSARLLATPTAPYAPEMGTLCIAGGRKDKVRPGDIMGALTGEAGLPGEAIGKISLFEFQACVAVRRDLLGTALQRLEAGKIKGRRFKVRKL